MKRIYTKNELLSLSNEKIKELTLGKYINVSLANGESKVIFVEELYLASNPPHLFVAFKPQNNPSINIAIIEEICLI